MLINLAGWVFAAGLMTFLFSYVYQRLEGWDGWLFIVNASHKWGFRAAGFALMLGSGALFSYSLPTPMAYKSDPVADWLFLMDESFYEDAWSHGAQSFKHSMNAAEFTKLAEKRREPLGKVVERVPLAALELSVLPDGRRGIFELHVYRTKFSSGAQREETVVVESEANEWKILNYNLNKNGTGHQQH